MLTLDAVINKVVEKAIVTKRCTGIPHSAKEIKQEKNANTMDGTKTNKKHVECQ